MLVETLGANGAHQDDTFFFATGKKSGAKALHSKLAQAVFAFDLGFGQAAYAG